MGRSKLQGTPWHYEYLNKSSNDSRRYKGRCKYYVYSTNDTDEHCSYSSQKCTGSSQCHRYCEITDEEFKQKQKEAQRQKQNKTNKLYSKYTNKHIRNLVKQNMEKKKKK